jgi:4-hydroxy-tetrahydrodipicolinate reductase
MLQNLSMTLKLAINGALGRMGKAVASAAALDGGFSLVCPIESQEHPDIGKDYGMLLDGKKTGVKVCSSLAKVDVLIDFSVPRASLQRLAEAEKAQTGVVIGTTGFSDVERKKIRNTARNIPVLLSSNMSYTVNYLAVLAADAAKKLGLFGVEIIEVHHRHKKDAPSGTARMLAESIAKARKIGTEQITIHSVRLGDYVGEHKIIFATDGESVEITHRARSREIFARGALVAGEFISKAKPGLYTMSDVVASNK